MTTPEQRSRELAKAAMGKYESLMDNDLADATASENDHLMRQRIAFHAYHDPSLIKAYAEVVAQARALYAESLERNGPQEGARFAGPLAALDSLSQEREEAQP